MGRKLILGMSVSIDGFVATPEGEIDWIFRHRSEASTGYITDRLGEAGLHLMGRRSYDGMASFWPTSTMPQAKPMNEIPKAVATRSGRITPPTPETTAGHEAAWESWQNPLVFGTDLVADIERLKEEDGKPILTLGGASFASSLVTAGLVDEFRLAVHPVALGRGLSMFAGLEEPLYLKLEELVEFESGAVIKIYRPT